MKDVPQAAEPSKVDSSFWDIALTETPWQLGKDLCSSLLDTDLGTNPVSKTIAERTLSQHPKYDSVVLKRDLYQVFHRADGKSDFSASSPISFPIRFRSHNVTNGQRQLPRCSLERRCPSSSKCRLRELEVSCPRFSQTRIHGDRDLDVAFGDGRMVGCSPRHKDYGNFSRATLR